MMLRTTICMCILVQLIVPAKAQTDNIKRAVEIIKQVCSYVNTSERLSVSTTAAGEISVKRLNANGQVQAEVKFDKSSVQGIVLGYNNEITAAAAEQANNMRSCGQPFLKQIVDTLVPPPRP